MNVSLAGSPGVTGIHGLDGLKGVKGEVGSRGEIHVQSFVLSEVFVIDCSPSLSLPLSFVVLQGWV